jgi:hypothetical protein
MLHFAMLGPLDDKNSDNLEKFLRVFDIFLIAR